MENQKKMTVREIRPAAARKRERKRRERKKNKKNNKRARKKKEKKRKKIIRNNNNKRKRKAMPSAIAAIKKGAVSNPIPALKVVTAAHDSENI